VLVGAGAACGARTALPVEEGGSGGGGAGGECEDVPRPTGVDGCLRFGRLGGPGAHPTGLLQAFLDQNGTSTERALDDGAPLTRDLLDRFDVVIVEAPTHTYSDEEVAALREWISAGGGAFFTSGYRVDGTDRPLTNSLMAALDLRYVDPLLNGDVVTFLPHEVTNGLATLPFLGGYHVELVPVATPAATTPIAQLENGVVAMAQQRGAGRALAWGDEWILFDSEWTAEEDVPIFWRNSIRWLAHQPP
jgi:hypothetical protein